MLTLAAAAVPRAAAETLNQSVVATIAVGTNPEAIVANPVTNKIYVANQGSNTVTVIDGLTNSTSTIAVGAAPLALAINTVTNKIYVVNSGSANVTAIDGATGSTSTIATASGGRAVAVNSATNQIFVVSPAVRSQRSTAPPATPPRSPPKEPSGSLWIWRTIACTPAGS